MIATRSPSVSASVISTCVTYLFAPASPGGLRRKVEVEREPVEVVAEPAPREDTSWKVLLDAGFTILGDWAHRVDGLLRISADAPSEPGVYAFVVDDLVVYVGVTLERSRIALRPVPPR